MTEPVDAPRVDASPTAVVADPRSDTINSDGGSVPEPIVEAEINEADVTALQQQLEEQRRIQSGLDKANTSLQGQVGQSQTRIEELEARLSAYSTADGATNDVLTDYMNQLEAKDAELAQFKQQAEEAIRSESRIRIVASEFTGLIPLIDAGALPRADDDEGFRVKMLILQDNFASAAEGRLADHVRGVKPPASPPSNAPPDVDAIKRDMLAAEPDSEEFYRARDQWYAALGVDS